MAVEKPLGPRASYEERFDRAAEKNRVTLALAAKEFLPEGFTLLYEEPRVHWCKERRMAARFIELRYEENGKTWEHRFEYIQKMPDRMQLEDALKQFQSLLDGGVARMVN